MLADDRPAYPAVGFLRLLFSGHFDRALLATALETALARHPLLQALVQRWRNGRFQWIAAENTESVLHWVPRGDVLAVSTPWPIDLRREVGLRIFLRESNSQTEMLLQIHHSCSDALGLMYFINDWLATYDQACEPRAEKPPLLPLVGERLRGRGRFGMTTAAWLARLPKDLLAALAAIEYFSHRPVPVASADNGPVSEVLPSLFPTVSAHSLSESETVRLRETARDFACTTNDLLLAILFMAIYRWNLLHRGDGKKGVLRIMIPMNLRSSDEILMPAANVVSYVYLDRRPHRFGSPRALIRSVRREMKICKRWRLGLTLVHFMRMFRALPGGLARMLPEDRCLATTVLSNVGQLTHSLRLPEREDGRLTAGNLVVERFDVLPPVRPWTAASFGVNSYAGRMSLAVHCDPYRFSPADAGELLATFARQITATLENPDELTLH